MMRSRQGNRVNYPPLNRAEYVRTITMFRAYCPSAQMAENAKARYLTKN